jgi:hypothetical protein
MAKTVKMSKMASKDDPQPTVLGTEGSIHVNLDQEIITGYQPTLCIGFLLFYFVLRLIIWFLLVLL